MNIVLIGYRAVGKTSIGRLLARELGMEFLDTDALLEMEAKRDIKSFVELNGWRAFRELESKVLRSLTGLDNHVIATGGGVVELVQNLQIIRSLGTVIWLKAPIPLIKERLAAQTRPPLTGRSPSREVEITLPKRIPLYQKAADLVMDTGSLSPSEATRMIRLSLKGLMSRDTNAWQ